MKISRALRNGSWVLLVAWLLGCGSSGSGSPASGSANVVAKGSRVLAVDAFNGTNLPSSLQAAQSLGGQSVIQLVTWTMIETSPNVYNTTVLQPTASLLPQQSISVSLMIAVINTTVKDMPSDLAGLALDDPTVIARFEALLDQIFAAIPSTQIVSLGIGNEVDAYLNSPALWTQYTNFYNAVAAYARSKRPGTRVGVEGTLYGSLGGAKTQMAALNQGSDVYMFSYYPLNADLTVKDPSTVAGDIDALVASYPGKPIEIREAGYPTSSQLNSSTDKQTAFVNAMFAEWDKYAGQIEYICFTRLNDYTSAGATAVAGYYGSSNPSFVAYLESLGLRAADGTPKPAFSALQSDAMARGW